MRVFLAVRGFYEEPYLKTHTQTRAYIHGLAGSFTQRSAKIAQRYAKKKTAIIHP